MPTPSRASRLWSAIAEALDIPRSLYDRAAARHLAVGTWLCRPESLVALHDPDVRPQGSFRYGTVIRPLDEDAEYDLDHIVVFRSLDPSRISQQALKHLLGRELEGYALAHGMELPTEHSRCWRLNYRDEVAFHLDSLPCVPDHAVVESLRGAGIEDYFATRAVAITDRRRPGYSHAVSEWLTSNPSGFARWFERRAALGRIPQPSETTKAANVEPVPANEWRTPLQQSIQILKRHRDVMFREAPELAPISMIITNLAAHAYQGQQDVADAMRGIVQGMGNFVRRDRPRVPNPTHLEEDYADKWAQNPHLEPNFWRWLAQVQADVEWFSDPFASIAADRLKERFDMALTVDHADLLASGAPAVHINRQSGPVPAVNRRLETGPKPWTSLI